MMTEENMKDYCSIEIRENEECVIATTNLRGKGNNEDKVNTVFSNIDAKLVSQALSMSPTPTCIFRVPERIKRLGEMDFVPRIVSIGPFHHGKKNLQAMEAVKLQYLQKLLLRKPTPQANLKHIVEEVTSMEDYCRDCYDENLDLSSEAFVEMMLVDGCFIIEFYRKLAEELPQDKDDVLKIESQHLSWAVVASDLFLLENQLPWKVVDRLFELTKELDGHNQVPAGKSKSLSELCCRRWGKDPVVTAEKTFKSRHLLDTYRLFSVEADDGGDNKRPAVLPLWVSLPSATELVQIGVEFSCKRSDDKILTISFINGVMEISPIIGHHYFCQRLRNLVVMEECEPRGPHHYQITSYCRVMNDLIQSTKDLEILMEKGILSELFISKEEMTGFFHNICNNTVTTSVSSKSLVELSRSVVRYYNKRWLRRWIASIKRDYLYNPASIWSISNAVVIVIVLTVIQTVYAFLSYHK